MLMENEQTITQDIRELKKEINDFYYQRNVFLGIGWGLMGLALASFIACFFVNSNEVARNFMSTVCALAIVGGIACFILRSALYNHKISSRKRLLAKAYEYEKKQQEEETTKENKNSEE